MNEQELSQKYKQFQECIVETYENLILEKLSEKAEDIEDYQDIQDYIDTDFQSEDFGYHLFITLSDIMIDLSHEERGDIYEALSDSAEECACSLIEEARERKKEQEE